MKVIKTFGNIRNGKLHIDKLKQVNEVISATEDCQVKMVISKLYGKMSDKQRGYYFGVIVSIWQDIMLANEYRHYNKDEMHEFLKLNFNTEDFICENSGLVLKQVKSITKSSTVDQEIYHKKCRDAAYDNFGVEIPLPEKQTELKFKNKDIVD